MSSFKQQFLQFVKEYAKLMDLEHHSNFASYIYDNAKDAFGKLGETYSNPQDKAVDFVNMEYAMFKNFGME